MRTLKPMLCATLFCFLAAAAGGGPAWAAVDIPLGYTPPITGRRGEREED
jgi:hypothetical protein